MVKIIGMTAVALLLGAPLAMAQSASDQSREYRSNGSMRGPADAPITTPRNDPDSTNNSRVNDGGPYHEEVAPGGTVTGPLGNPNASNGG